MKKGFIVKKGREFLGSQLWLEPDDTKERVHKLVENAYKSGLGWLRIFLMWQFIEEKEGEWNFSVYDYAFSECEKYGIKIKATLTANTGPWHIGTAMTLHTFTGILEKKQWQRVEEYIAKCVKRYKDSPALGQWILWNEPARGNEKGDEALEHWHKWLEKNYRDISELNHKWRTGFISFDEVDFPEDIPYSRHSNSDWNPYKPFIDRAYFSMRWLEWELSEIQRIVRKYDSKTPTCINPTPLLDNQVSIGVDQNKLGDIVDCLGASYHPAWNFTYANRNLFPAMMASGIKKSTAYPLVKEVEVTEVQSGNTLNSSIKPCFVEDSELAKFYLSTIFSGASSVTGWLLNIRSYDFEAGDWGLLDDNDNLSSRCEVTMKVAEKLTKIAELTGGFKPKISDVFVATDLDSQAVEYCDGKRGGSVKGRTENDGSQGQTMLNVALLQAGVNSTMCRLCDISQENNAGKIVFLSHIVAWSQENADIILNFAKTGGTVVFDATCGRKNENAEIYRPWPGVIGEEIGLTAKGLETLPNGYDISMLGKKIGNWLLARMIPDMSSDWKVWEELTYSKDGKFCVFEREYNEGKFVFVNGIIGPSLVHLPEESFATKYIIEKIVSENKCEIRPVAFTNSAFPIQIDCKKGNLYIIFAENLAERKGKPLHIIAPKGKYIDLWENKELTASDANEITYNSADGIVLLWKE